MACHVQECHVPFLREDTIDYLDYRRRKHGLVNHVSRELRGVEQVKVDTGIRLDKELLRCHGLVGDLRVIKRFVPLLTGLECSPATVLINDCSNAADGEREPHDRHQRDQENHVFSSRTEHRHHRNYPPTWCCETTNWMI